MKTILLLSIAFLLSFSANEEKLTVSKKISLTIAEPSGICHHPEKDIFYVVSDNGLLFQTDKSGKVMNQADYTGLDFEDVFYRDNKVYVIEEMTRNIRVFDTDLKLINTYHIPYNGGRNKGFESITFNPKNNCFLMAIEKEPTDIFLLNTDFEINHRINFPQISDISALCIHENNLWILSDEDHTIYLADAESYQINKQYSLPIINPEGLCFDNDGNLYVTSDDREILYIFNKTDL